MHALNKREIKKFQIKDNLSFVIPQVKIQIKRKVSKIASFRKLNIDDS